MPPHRRATRSRKSSPANTRTLSTAAMAMTVGLATMMTSDDDDDIGFMYLYLGAELLQRRRRGSRAHDSTGGNVVGSSSKH
ncbi:hypothetical protein FRC12_009202 [Ceratobasidium sp. 428]|nr:hypothetical protein FRC12_009202 [Ceratobasidium sp. 428]